MKLIYQLFFDYFCFGKKFLVYNMVSRNIKSKYDRSIIGLGWTLLSPMMLAVIYYIVFKKIMHVQTSVLPRASPKYCCSKALSHDNA